MTLQPTPDDKFTFGLWTVGNPGRDPFGQPTRPDLAPAEIVELLAEAGGVLGVNFHDNDLVPIDAGDSEADAIKRDFRRALDRTGLRVCMATTNLFADPVFKDGAFTSNDAEVRAYAVHKTMHAMDLGAEFGADVYVMWGGREGCETDASKDPVESLARYRDAVNFLTAYSRHKGYPYRFALEPKPNEPRGHIFLPTIGHCLAFIDTLDDRDIVGVNPEVAHEHMAGLNFSHAVAMALWKDKLFHIDLNDQAYGRYDQDFRFASESPKAAFFLVKLLEDHAYAGYKHFDSHAYRTSDRADVIAFARGSMRTYLALREKARRWNADPVIRDLLAQLPASAGQGFGAFSPEAATDLHARDFDRAAIAACPLPYEALDQRTTDILLGLD
jgi:xylose isomerase